MQQSIAQKPGAAATSAGWRFGAWLDALVLALVFIGMAAWTWRKWPDPLVDFGRELYVPWQIAEGGKVLYRDIAHFNGPLSPYFNALLFRVFGPGMMVLAGANMALLAIMTAALYSLLRQSSSRLAATAACVFMLLVFAFGQMTILGNYNFVTPYAHEVTHGVVLTIVGLWFLRRAVIAARLRWVAAGGVALGAVFLTKPEVFIAAVASMGVLVLFSPSPQTKLWKKKWGVLALSAILPLAIATALFAMAVPLSQSIRSVLGGWNFVFDPALHSLPFYRAGMGMDVPGDSLRRMFICAGCYSGLMLLALAVAVLTPVRHRSLSAVSTFVGGALVLAIVWRLIDWSEALRGLPVGLTGAGVVAAVAWLQRSDGPSRSRWSLRLSLSVFAVAMLAKMILYTRPYHYGFALAMPGTLVFATVLVGWLPEWVGARGGAAGAAAALGLAVLLMTAAAYVNYLHRALDRRVYAVGEVRDMFYADERGELVQRVVGQLKKNVTPQEGLVVLPEGVMLNYLARLPNPTPYLNFMPPELIMFGEETILQSLQRASPRYLLLTHKETAEYGYEFFGRDYGQSIGYWIGQHYRPQALYGDPPLRRGSEFGILVLERDEAEPPSSP